MRATRSRATELRRPSSTRNKVVIESTTNAITLVVTASEPELMLDVPVQKDLGLKREAAIPV